MAEVQKDNHLGNREDTIHFVILVQMFAQQAMMQMGKIANPITHKAERDLDGAQFTIGILEMLEEKTRGNLNKDEERLLKNVLTDLRLNYVEEARQAQTKTETPGEAAQAPAPESAPKPQESEDPKVKFHKKYD